MLVVMKKHSEVQSALALVQSRANLLSGLTLSLFAKPNGDLRYDGPAIFDSNVIDCLMSGKCTCSQSFDSRRLRTKLADRHGRIDINLALWDFLYQTCLMLTPLHKMAAAFDKIDEGLSRSIYRQATEAAEFIRAELPSQHHHPRVAIVCGSGLGGIADTIGQDARAEINFADIPHFPQITGTKS